VDNFCFFEITQFGIDLPSVALSIRRSDGASSAANAKSEYVMRSDQNLWSSCQPRYEIVTWQCAYFTRHG